MKRFLAYFFCMLIAVALGAFGMYYLMGRNTEGTTKIQREVTVTDNGIAEGIQNIYDAVVVVENYKRNRLAGIGSGFIYSNEGDIMTNHHVVEGASEIKIILANGETISAKVVGSDEYADIAVIKID